MEFFGFGDLSTPVGKQIEQATSELLIGPDWSLNMDVCDMIKNDRTLEGNQKAVKALRKRLKSDNPKIVQLTLILTEACVKNCGSSFHQSINQEFMTDMISLADGKKGREVREQSLALIQQWGRAFESQKNILPIFYATYTRLKAKNVEFPPINDSDVATPPPAPSRSSNPITSNAAPVPKPEGVTEASLDKLRKDLEEVNEKIGLCKEMLPQSPGIQHDEILSEIVGFLEACRPRMVDLIEAGMQGLLGEELMELILKVNDDLHATLEAEKNGAVSAAAPEPVKSNPDGTQDLLGFDDAAPRNPPRPVPTVAPAAAPTIFPVQPTEINQNDPFAALLTPIPPAKPLQTENVSPLMSLDALPPANLQQTPLQAPGQTSLPTEPPQPNSVDDFEAFLRDRTG